MIIKKHVYSCSKCNERCYFEVDKSFSTLCPNCNTEMQLVGTFDCDTERAERVKNMPAYDPTKDPKSPYYIPVVKCPYCSSTKTTKISATSKLVNTAVFGIFGSKRHKQWHCKSCNSDF